MVEEIREKVTEAQAKADLNIELIGDLLGDQLRQDSNVVPRLEKLEKQQLLCKLREELRELKGGEKMTDEKIKYIPEADYNQDGVVSKTEYTIFEFFRGVNEGNRIFMTGVVNQTQKISLWSMLGTMVFALALLGFWVFTKS